MSGKPVSSSRSSISEPSPGLRPQDDPSSSVSSQPSRSARQDNRQYYSEKLIAQVSDWLDHERRKASSRKKRTPHVLHHHHPRRTSNSPPESRKSRGLDTDSVDPTAAPPQTQRELVQMYLRKGVYRIFLGLFLFWLDVLPHSGISGVIYVAFKFAGAGAIASGFLGFFMAWETARGRDKRDQG